MNEDQFRAELLARFDLMIEGLKTVVGYLHCIDAKLHGAIVPTPEHKDAVPAMAVRVVQGKEDKARRFVGHADPLPVPDPGKKGKG
jgi:hypothetical protein